MFNHLIVKHLNNYFLWLISIKMQNCEAHHEHRNRIKNSE